MRVEGYQDKEISRCVTRPHKNVVKVFDTVAALNHVLSQIVYELIISHQFQIVKKSTDIYIIYIIHTYGIQLPKLNL